MASKWITKKNGNESKHINIGSKRRKPYGIPRELAYDDVKQIRSEGGRARLIKTNRRLDLYAPYESALNGFEVKNSTQEPAMGGSKPVPGKTSLEQGMHPGNPKYMPLSSIGEGGTFKDVTITEETGKYGETFVLHHDGNQYTYVSKNSYLGKEIQSLIDNNSSNLLDIDIAQYEGFNTGPYYYVDSAKEVEKLSNGESVNHEIDIQRPGYAGKVISDTKARQLLGRDWGRERPGLFYDITLKNGKTIRADSYEFYDHDNLVFYAGDDKVGGSNILKIKSITPVKT